MKIYQITNLGIRLARSIKNPDTPTTKVLNYLDNRGSATTDQIVNYTGMDGGTVGNALRKLKGMNVVSEVAAIYCHIGCYCGSVCDIKLTFSIHNRC